jgi:transposase-like protein
MHTHKRAEKIHGRGPDGKAIVAAVLERGGEVRVEVMKTRKKRDLHKLVRENVEAGSSVYTDALKSYDGLDEFKHQVVDHAETYVNGQVHTNGCENFWSLLKRSIHGTYVSVEPFHLFRYLDEQAFRYNHRKHEDGEPKTDAERFDIAVSQIVGKRLTYQELIGHADDEPF